MTSRRPVGARLFCIAIAAVAALRLAAPSRAEAQTEVSITIRESRAYTIPLGVETIQPAGRSAAEAALAAAVQRVLTNDLELSGLFDLVPFSASDPETSYADLRAVVRGRVWIKGTKSYLQGWMEEYPLGRVIFMKRWGFKAEATRRAVHKFSDEVVLYLTGEKGIAQTKIAFISTAGGYQELHVMDYDGFGERALTAHRSICLSPAWSPDGKVIAFTGYRRGNPDLYGIKSTGGKSWVISDRPGINSAPAFSPDGRRIAYTLSVDGNAEIYVARADGSDPKRLTNNPAIDSSPTWSPGGDQIAFTSNRSGTPQIYVMDADGTNVRRLTFEGSLNDSADWSPKGDRIVYVSRREGRMEICTISAVGGDEQPLTWRMGNNENPRWAPDGRHVCFSSTRTGRREIFIMNDDGSGQRQISSGPGEKFCPAWSPRFED